jgi:YD repeat-containing protein
MINDSQKGTIAYNYLSLVKSVTKGSDVLKYTYDATGRRIKKQLNNATPRLYMDGIERSGDTTMIHTEYGRIRRNAAADPWKWDYFLKDHLGNVRVVLEAPVQAAGAARGRDSPG